LCCVTRGIRDLARAGFVAVVERSQRPHAALACRRRVAYGYTHARWRTVGMADNAAPPAHRLANAAKSGTRRIGAGLTIAGHTHDDQSGIDLAQLGRVQ